MVESGVDESPIQSVSTRIRLDGGTGECEACGGSIDGGERFKVAAIETGGRIVYRDFCGRDCIDDWETA